MQEVITIQMETQTLKGAILGGVVVFAFLLLVYRIARQISKDRIQNDMRNGGYDNTYHTRNNRPGGFLNLLFVVVPMAILMGMYSYSSTPKPSAAPTIEDAPMSASNAEGGEWHFEDTPAPSYGGHTQPSIVQDDAVLFVADNGDTAGLGEIESPHYLQVAASDDLDKARSSLGGYQQAHPGHTVHIAVDSNGGAYPVKILIGPFESEAQARRAAKTRQPYKNVHSDGLKLLPASERTIY